MSYKFTDYSQFISKEDFTSFLDFLLNENSIYEISNFLKQLYNKDSGEFESIKDENSVDESKLFHLAMFLLYNEVITYKDLNLIANFYTVSDLENVCKWIFGFGSNQYKSLEHRVFIRDYIKYLYTNTTNIQAYKNLENLEKVFKDIHDNVLTEDEKNLLDLINILKTIDLNGIFVTPNTNFSRFFYRINNTEAYIENILPFFAYILNDNSFTIQKNDIIEDSLLYNFVNKLKYPALENKVFKDPTTYRIFKFDELQIQNIQANSSLTFSHKALDNFEISDAANIDVANTKIEIIKNDKNEKKLSFTLTTKKAEDLSNTETALNPIIRLYDKFNNLILEFQLSFENKGTDVVKEELSDNESLSFHTAIDSVENTESNLTSYQEPINCIGYIDSLFKNYTEFSNVVFQGKYYEKIKHYEMIRMLFESIFSKISSRTINYEYRMDGE